METTNKFLLNRKQNCKNCNTTYKPKSNNSKYCSVTCANKVYYKRKFPNTKNIINKKFYCLFCKTEFINKSHNQKKYCNSVCKNKFKRQSNDYKKWYKNYIKSEKFKNCQKKYQLSTHGSKKIKEIRKKYQPILNQKLRIYKKTEKGKRMNNYHCALRYSRKKQRTPKWISKQELFKIKQFYLNRPIGYEVDHIIPLCGENVSGLHVLKNLQYLPAEKNRIKNKKFEPYHV